MKFRVWTLRFWRFVESWYKDIMLSRYKAYSLFKRQLAQQYRYSSLGLLWAFVPMTLTAAVLMGGQRSRVIGTFGEVPGAFYGIFGVALAQTFLEALNATRRIFITNQYVLRRQSLPVEPFIMADCMQLGFTMNVRLAILVSIYLLFSVAPPSPVMAFIALLGYIGIAFTGAGIGLLLAPLTALTQDLEQLANILPWIIFAITPVFVPINTSSFLGHIAGVNPLTWVFDGIRAAAYGGEGIPGASFAAAVLGLIMLLLGSMFCRLARPHVVERLMM